LQIVWLVLSKFYATKTCFREDEKERVQKCGACVLTAGQVEVAAAAMIDGTLIPEIETIDGSEADEGDPPRLWVKDGMYPGTAFTRSVGDLTAEGIGVVADPEVRVVRISPSHLFFVLASDGVFEFLSSQAVVDMVVIISLCNGLLIIIKCLLLTCEVLNVFIMAAALSLYFCPVDSIFNNASNIK
jgi:Protein phosphatase 2C